MMACDKESVLILILLSLFTLSFTSEAEAKSSECTGGIAVYWGQNLGENKLSYTCDSGNFEIVNLAFLNFFGYGQTPAWNFAGHCGDWDPCTKLEPEIQHCQNKGVKVFLSLGGARGDYGISSPQDAKVVAKYLYDNFLSGQYGPLGSVTLDGIDFDIEAAARSNLHWDDLARELDSLRQKPNKYFYLSAAPQCIFPDHYLDAAIKTGLFDDIFVQFYNNAPCQISATGNTDLLFKSWDSWTSYVSPNTLFLGLPASPDAAPNGGYIDPQKLIYEVLPYVKKASNYGGVMLWDRFHDLQNNNNYSDKIKPYVPKCDLFMHSVTDLSHAIYE